jgi:fatty acid desaturase
MNDLSHKIRLRRGYSLAVPVEIEVELKRLQQSCTPCSVAWAFAYVMTIYVAIGMTIAFLSMVAAATSLQEWLLVAFLTYQGVTVFIARQQRGMELMVHDASHGAWHHLNEKMNNILADFIVAAPVLMTVSSYWRSHRVHHGRYGSMIDPCRQRFQRMGLGHVDLSTPWKIAKAVIRWLPAYNLEYYREVGSAKWSVWRNFLAWHFIVFFVPVGLVSHIIFHFSVGASVAIAFAIWGGFWLTPALTALPVLRSIAEAEEHDYERGNTEFDTTFTNTGLLHTYVFHPWNDEYHLIHHMFPNLSQRTHPRVHKLLLQHDEQYRRALHRKKILQKS